MIFGSKCGIICPYNKILFEEAQVKAQYEGKMVLEFGKYIVAAFFGGPYVLELPSGNEPVVMIPTLKKLGVAREGRQLMISNSVRICIERNEGYVLVRPLEKNEPGLQQAILADPDVQKLTEKAKAEINRVLVALPDGGEIGKLMTFLFDKVNWLAVGTEILTTVKKAYPGFWDKNFTQVDLGAINELLSQMGGSSKDNIKK